MSILVASRIIRGVFEAVAHDNRHMRGGWNCDQNYTGERDGSNYRCNNSRQLLEYVSTYD
jgi:hypothetical protein